MAEVEDELYDERFLVRPPAAPGHRPSGDGAPVLLIDEVDRADDEFEAFLLEILSDWAVTVPELGTVRATVPPVVVITSNRTRDVHDALKRRCLYHWVEHPTFEREVAIVELKVPDATDGSPARWPAPSRAYGSWGCTSRRAWPRRSTGRGAGHPRASDLDDARRSRPPSARSSSTARTPTGAVVRDRAAGGGRPCPRRLMAPVAVRPCLLRRAASTCRTRSCRSPRPSPCSTSTAARAAYWAGRATLVRRSEDIAAYDRGLRRLLVRGPNGAGSRPAEPRSPSPSSPTTPRRTTTGTPGGDDELTRELRFSTVERLSGKDFAACRTTSERSCSARWPGSASAA